MTVTLRCGYFEHIGTRGQHTKARLVNCRNLYRCAECDFGLFVKGVRISNRCECSAHESKTKHGWQCFGEFHLIPLLYLDFSESLMIAVGAYSARFHACYM